MSSVTDKPIAKSVMKHKLCAWQDRKEFIEVYKCLFSNSLLDMQRGIKRVQLWESRISNLPISIYATAAIVNAEIKDDLMSSGIPTIMSPEDLRQMHALAITRFLNAVVEKASECEGLEVRSQRAAKATQLPLWIVNLRNAAVHNNMPSLDVLRSGTTCAKKWLVKNYWEPELSSFKDFIELEIVSKTDIQETIAKYLDRRSYLMLTPNINQTTLAEKENELMDILVQMGKQVLLNHKTFFETLIAPGVFLHDALELAAFLDFAGSDFVVDGRSPLPERLTDLWMPMIVMLNEQNLMQEFLEALFKYQDQPDETSRHIITGWCRLLMDTKRIYDSDLQDIPKNERPCLSWIRLMAACTKYPTKYSALLLPEIMDKIETLSDVKKILLTVVVGIHTGMGLSEEKESSPPNKRVKTDISDKNVRRAFSTDYEFWNKSIIQIAEDDINWESTPLGMVYNRKLVKPQLDQTSADKGDNTALQIDSLENEEMVGFCHIEDVYSEGDLCMDEDGSDSEPVITYSLFN